MPVSKQSGRVLVLANCVHYSVALALRNAGVFAEVDSAQLFSMSQDELDDLAGKIDGYDHILTLEHGDRFGPLATAEVRKRVGDRLHSLPTPFFSGLSPDMAYLIYDDSLSRSAAVLGDYHSALLLEEVRAGFSDDDIVRRYVSGEAFDRLDVEAIWQDNLNALHAREKTTEIALSPYIEAEAEAGRIAGQFLSFNHPTEGLIDHIARSFLTRLGHSVSNTPLLTTAQHNLYADVYWPLHPAVAERLGLPEPDPRPFKRPDYMGGDLLEPETFARQSIEFFRDGHDMDLFKIVTPDYLADRISPADTPVFTSTKARHSSMVKKKKSTPKASRSSTKAIPNIVMTHFGRSGSTVLSELLKQHSRIAWLDEYFSLKWIRDRSTYNFTLPQLTGMIAEETDKVHRARPDAMVGYEIKLMNFLQNPSCNMVDYAEAVADPKSNVHIVLRRRNTLKRICSVYKANQTKVYHRQSTAGGDYVAKTFQIEFDDLIDFDTGERAATMPELIAKAQAREEQVLANYRRLGLTYLELFYEDDIEANPLRAYERIVDHLGLEREPAEISLAKTGKPLKEDLQNYAELEAQMRGSAYEWMLG